MKINAKLTAAIVFIITVTVLSVIAFLLLEETDYFWVTYSFTLVAAIVFFLVLVYYLRDKKRTFKEFPANAPYAYVAIQYIIFEVILAAVFCLFGGLAGLDIIYFVSAEIILALIFGIRMVLAFGAKKMVMDVENTASVKTKNWQMYTSDMQAAYSSVQRFPETIRNEASKILSKAFEAVRYADPVSNPSLSALESRIQKGISDIGEEAERLATGKSSDIGKLRNSVIELEKLIEERNSRMKTLKL